MKKQQVLIKFGLNEIAKHNGKLFTKITFTVAKCLSPATNRRSKQPTEYGIYNTLNKTLGEMTYVMHPSLSAECSPSDPLNSFGAICYAKHIQQKVKGGMKKPIIAIWNNSSKDETAKRRMTMWQAFVIFPKEYKNFENTQIQNQNENFYFVNPFKNQNRYLPYLLIYLLKHQRPIGQDGSLQGQSLREEAIFPDLKFCTLTKKRQQLEESECGFWVIYNTIMIALKKKSNFQLFNSSYQYVGNKILSIFPNLCENQNDKQMVENATIHIQKSKLIEKLVQQTLKQRIREKTNSKLLESFSLYYLSMVYLMCSDDNSFEQGLLYLTKKRFEKLQKPLKTKNKIEPYINLGLFGQLIDQQMFVDKTLLIKQIFETLQCSNKHILITRPRRWGKTIILRMIKTFLQIRVNGCGEKAKINQNIKLFKGEITQKRLKIADFQHIMKQAGEWPVVHLYLQGLSSYKGHSLMPSVKYRIHYTFEQHLYMCTVFQKIIKSADASEAQKELALGNYNRFKQYLNNHNQSYSQEDLYDSLKFLTQILSNHFKKKVFLLVDYYDSVFNKKMESEDKSDATAMWTIYERAIKGNKHLKQAIMIGIRPFANKFVTDNFVLCGVQSSKYAQYIGFTQSEVDQLSQQVLGEGLIQLPSIKKQMKNFYKGYLIGETIIYNIWSIRSHLQQLNYQNEWINSGSSDNLEKIFLSLSNSQQINSLIQRGEFEMEINRSIDLFHLGSEQELFFFSLLHLGYITQGPRQNSYKIPNLEVKKGFLERIKQLWIKKMLNTAYVNNAQEIIQSTIDKFEQSEDYKKALKLKIFPNSNKIKNESDVYILMREIFSYQQPSKRNHQVHSQAYFFEQKKWDNLFLPIEGKSETVIIQEYKFANSAVWEPSNIAQNTLWNIYGREYLSVALGQLIRPHWRLIKVRAITFIEKRNVSNIQIKQYRHTVKQALEIAILFQTEFDLAKEEGRKGFLHSLHFGTLEQLLTVYSLPQPRSKRTSVAKNPQPMDVEGRGDIRQKSIDNAKESVCRIKMKNNRDKKAAEDRSKIKNELRKKANCNQNTKD